MNSKDVEKIVLPSDYNVSRVQMTSTKYRTKKLEQASSLIEKKHLDFFDFLKFRKENESKIIFTEKDFQGCKSIAEKILRIITSQKYRTGNMNLIKLEKHRDELLSKLKYYINREEPVKFMLPAFPFKVRNPLKSSRMDADLAEVASFCKFNEINLQIKKIYQPGAQFIIFHDGHLYYRHFLHTKEDADRYFNSLNRFIGELQIGNALILKDASDELLKFIDFKEVYSEARLEMQNLWDAEKDTNNRILKIRKSASSNINLSDIAEEILYIIATKTDSKLNTQEKEIKHEILKRADLCAFEYMVVQHTLEKLGFFDQCVPNGVRLTVHPKEGQVGVSLVKKTTFLLPWMGVGVKKKDGEISVRYQYEVKNNFKFIPVYVGTDEFPFYYEEK